MTILRDNSISLAENSVDSREGSAYGSTLILALDRLFKVGPYYPPGHAACKRVTSDFQNVLKKFLENPQGDSLGDCSVLTFRVDGSEIFLQDRPLDPDLPGANDFQDLLLILGIDYLEIDSHASVDDLLMFVTRFLAFRNEIAGVKKFQKMAFEGLPSTIRIGQRQFTTGIAITGNGPAGSDEGSGAGTGDVSSDNTEAENPAGIPQAVDTEEEGSPEVVEDENVALTDNLDHALNPNGNYVAAPPRLAENKRPVAENLDTLIDHLEGAGQTDIRSRALESVELMIKNLGRGDKANLNYSDFLGTDKESPQDRQNNTIQKKPSEKSAENSPQLVVYEMSMPDLRSALADYAGQGITEYSPTEQDNSENLSIIIQLLARKQPQDVLHSMERKLARILRKALQSAERNIMLSGVRHLLSQPKTTAQSKSMGLISRVLRKSPAESVISFFGEACDDCTEEQQRALWPYIVNELLLGGNGEDRPTYMKLCRRVGEHSLSIMRDGTPTLRKLEAMKKNSFCEDAILSPLPELFPVFSVLLDVSHPGQLAVKLVQGLKDSPPAGVGDAVLPLISSYRHSYREFLVELLAPGQEDGPSDALLEEAGKILATDLISLSPARRSEAWVPDTIASLAELPVPGAESILKTIKSRRFLFLFPTWPPKCRIAAKEALDQRRINELATAAANEAAKEAVTEAATETATESEVESRTEEPV